MEVKLPSGNIVTLKDRVSNATRRRYLDAIDAAPSAPLTIAQPVKGPDGRDLLDEEGNPILHDVTIQGTTMGGTLSTLSGLMVELIVSWTDETPPPKSGEELDEILTTEDWDTLAESLDPIISHLFPKLTKPDPDPDSPTPPLSE